MFDNVDIQYQKAYEWPQSVTEKIEWSQNSTCTNLLESDYIRIRVT